MIGRKAEGLTLTQVRETVERELAFAAGATGPLSEDARAARRARAEEWDRIIGLMSGRGLDVYRARDDPDAVAWAADRAARKSARTTRYEQCQQDRWDETHGLRLDLHLVMLR
ncbi:hypothetical protein ACIRF8_35670 [Streptomyces sp. NPDC102406]|uniref:hypothetical protein n=1 Tax=Streptomyces sp. NPDC102406 TaxID=3366171 RepID=UPI0037FC3542